MATTVNTLETDTEVFKGDRVVADGVERSLLDVTDSSTSLVSSIDPFGDGSLIYKLEMEDATATVGTNPTNTGVTFTTGNGGQFSEAGVFNGTSSRLSDTPDYTVGMSVSFWIKTSELTANMPIILFDVSGKAINIWGGVVYVQYANSNSSNAAANAIISSGVWTHVVGIFNTASSTSLYINGVLQSGTPVLNWVTTGTTPMIGSRGVLDAFLNGSLDQIEYYNRALTPTEVTTLYTQTGTKYTADFNTPLASIPTSVYRLDHDNLTIDGTPTATTATVLDSRTGLIASGDTVLLDGVGVVCDPVVEGTIGSVVVNDEFETVLYAGTSTNQTINMTNITTGVDFVWLKARNGAWNHNIYDSIRGAKKLLYSDSTSVEVTRTDDLSAFNANGFDLEGSEVVINRTGYNYVAWCASLPNHTPSNTAGTITSETKANSFMSAGTYTGTGATGTVGAGITFSGEDLVIVKARNSAQEWAVANSTIGGSNYLYLNTTQASSAVSTIWNNTLPSGNTFSVGTAGVTGVSAREYVFYAFTSVAGKCKVGSYTGTGASGNAVDCGFEPAWVMLKRTDSTGNWVVLDNKRDTDGILDSHIYADSSQAELTNDVLDITPNSSGFSVDATNAIINASGGTYIYLAIAKEVGSTTPKYDLTYPTQTAPTRIALSNNDIVPTVASDTFDGTDTFTRTYNTVTKTARDVEYGFVADSDVEVVQLNINQNMEP